jgi:hypothetical protein
MQPKLDPAFRRAIFQTTLTSSDRKHAVDEAVFLHAVKVNGSIPTPKGRKRTVKA